MPQFHPQVRRDATQAIRYYDSISDSLGDDFWAQFEDACHRVESHPERFHFDPSGWRRANLERFPYHLLFYEESDGVRIMTLRRPSHRHQDPARSSRSSRHRPRLRLGCQRRFTLETALAARTNPGAPSIANVTGEIARWKAGLV